MSFTARIIAGNTFFIVISVVIMTLLNPKPDILISLVVGICLLAGSSLILWMLSSRAFKPLASIVSALEKAAGGDLSTRVHINDNGEFGRVATAFNSMMTDMNKTMRQFFSVADLVRDSVG